MLLSAIMFMFGDMKWMGNLLFFSLQMEWFAMAWLDEFEPMMAAIGEMKRVMGYN